MPLIDGQIQNPAPLPIIIRGEKKHILDLIFDLSVSPLSHTLERGIFGVRAFRSFAVLRHKGEIEFNLNK